MTISRARSLLKDFMPPIFSRLIQNRSNRQIYFEETYLSWEDASTKCSGYDAENILAKVLDATLRVKQGEAVYERDSVLFEKIEYCWLVLAGLMWAAARNGGHLNVLDFGGSLGSSYFQNLRFLRDLADVRWNVVEQKHYVSAGRKYIQDNQLRFYDDIDSCLSENRPNVVLLSSVLQYLKSPDQIIHQLSQVGASILIIDRTPFSNLDYDTLAVQNISASIYEASYPMWIFSEKRFDSLLANSWAIVSRNLSPEGYFYMPSNLKFS